MGIRYKDNRRRQTENLSEQTMLNEMATIVDKSYGLGIKIVIHSNDHLPEHMHIDDVATNKTIAKVLIPSEEPKTIDDIQIMDGSLNNKQKRDILDVLR